MTIATVWTGSAFRLPQPLRDAQEAIHFPEVQEMLRRLSAHRFGIFMPHLHDGQTGEFEPLPDQIMQVESGLEVSLRPIQDIESQSERFLTVGWFRRAGGPVPSTACEGVQSDSPSDGGPPVKHKMPQRT
jgi:hypothetical protein